MRERELHEAVRNNPLAILRHAEDFDSQSGCCAPDQELCTCIRRWLVRVYLPRVQCFEKNSATRLSKRSILTQ